VACCFEDVLHLTGLYPDWWVGRRFACPTDIWVAGETNKSVRDILAHELLGPVSERGTGMIPGDLIADISTARGVADSVDTVLVRHVTGGLSSLAFKSYGEGRANFQGSSRAVIHFDEEPPMDCYLEALMRTMTLKGDSRGGICMLSFTPLMGWSEVVDMFLGEQAA
jgi:phage terminase large subunit-like protein